MVPKPNEAQARDFVALRAGEDLELAGVAVVQVVDAVFQIGPGDRRRLDQLARLGKGPQLGHDLFGAGELGGA
jgi:hypothetical protein